MSTNRETATSMEPRQRGRGKDQWAPPLSLFKVLQWSPDSVVGERCTGRERQLHGGELQWSPDSVVGERTKLLDVPPGARQLQWSPDSVVGERIGHLVGLKAR